MWFWLFWFYSFLGYLLERLFARLTHSPRQVRKCFLLLPLCPVYGIAMVLFLALTDLSTIGPLHLIFRGALIATITEYLVHLFYEVFFAVRFWDYSQLPGNLNGRVALPFSLLWGLLSALAVRLFQPILSPLAAAMPPLLTLFALMLLTADAVCTAALLSHYHDTELLTLRAVRGRLRE